VLAEGYFLVLDGAAGLQQEQHGKALKRLERDIAIAAELLATFVGYFLTITPPLAGSRGARPFG
jgi:hypothetical protein